MRVLHFFKTYWPDTFGGVERVIHALAKGCAQRGVETDVLALSHTPSPTPLPFAGHTIYQTKCDFEFASTGFSRSAFKAFKERAEEADIIHYHFPWPFMDLVELATRHSKPIVVTYHSDIVKQKKLLQLYRPLMHTFLDRADAIVATSPNYVASSPTLSRYEAKTKVIPLGLDSADYPAADAERLAYWKNRFPRGFFLFTGVLRYYKGIHILLDAAKISGLPVVVVGGNGIEAEIQQRQRDENISQLHLLGVQDDTDKIALLTLCRALVFPSQFRSEAFGLSLVEAAMFAKPMISCEIGTGTSFVNLDQKTGIVIPPSDANALAQAMQRIWASDDDVKKFGAASRQHYLDNFCAYQMIDSYMSLYQSLVSPKRPE